MTKIQGMFTGLMAFGLAACASSPANKPEITTNVVATLEQFYGLNPTNRALEVKASGLLVFPKITKGGMGVGGEYGVGALEVKGKIVGYYKISGGSVGATLGAEKRSEIIMFMTRSALDGFTRSKGWTIGVDANIAVVKGVGGEYDTETLEKPIIGFVFDEKGGMIDMSLEGSRITPYR